MSINGVFLSYINHYEKVKTRFMSNKQRIFISHSYNDRNIADLIANKLINEGLEVMSGDNIQVGDSYFEEIKYLYESSEIVLVLLSESLFRNERFHFEFPRFFFEEARKRKVTIIPILIEKCNIPNDFLEYDIFNLTNNFEKGLEKIIQKLKVIPEISFDHFTPQLFEEFTYDLLKEFGFKNIKRESNSADKGIDFMSEYYSTNPFGIKKRETWIVEVKYYREARFSINAIKQLVELYKYVGKEDAKILLVTNSLLTSVAEEYLQEIRNFSHIDIDLLDGLILKKLVSRRKRLLNKYFL